MLNRILGKEIAAYVNRHRGLLVCSLCLTAISSLFLIIPAYLVQPFVDEGMRSGSDLVSWKIPWITFDSGSWLAWRRTERILVEQISSNSLLLFLSCIAFLSVLMRSITKYLGSLFAAAFSNQAVKSLRIDLYNKFLNLHHGFYHGRKSGELIARAVSDLTVMQNLIADVFIGLLEYPLTAGVFICYLFFVDYKLTLLVFFLGPSFFVLIWLFGRKVRNLATIVQDANADVSAAYYENLVCLKVTQSFCAEAWKAHKFRELVNILYKKLMHWYRWFLGLGPLLAMVVFIVLPIILITAKSYFHHTLGELLSMFYAFTKVYTPIKKIAAVNNNLKTIQGSTKRIFSIMETMPAIQDSPKSLELPRHSKAVIFEDVTFGYTPEVPILRNISFEVKKGEMVAFVGATGAGKSTLLDLIPRFYDVSDGKITIDDIDIRDVTLKSLRGQIGIVSQEILLFNDTIAYNIGYGRGSDKVTKEIEAVAKEVYAHDFILDQPNGYQSPTGDRGNLLSGGQKQRIAIARALLINPSIIILDEITSALDAESDRFIQEMLEKLRGRLTIFIAAHRLRTIMRADRVYFIEEGKIMESGIATTLLALNGRFRKFHDLQFKS